MTKDKALKLALEALELPSMKTQSMLEQRDAAIGAVKAALAQPEQEPAAVSQLLNRLEHQWHRMGELWERCQSKGWPSAESDEFAALRDEKTPANRAALLAVYTPLPKRQPLTEEQEPVDEVVRLAGVALREMPRASTDWHKAAKLVCEAVAAHRIKGTT
jgi:hypothetical protein